MEIANSRQLGGGQKKSCPVIGAALFCFLYPCGEQWAYQDSNLGPTGYEPAALPLSYRPNG